MWIISVELFAETAYNDNGIQGISNQIMLSFLHFMYNLTDPLTLLETGFLFKFLLRSKTRDETLSVISFFWYGLPRIVIIQPGIRVYIYIREIFNNVIILDRVFEE